MTDGVRFIKPGVRALSAYHVDLPEVRCKLNQNESPLDFPAELKALVARELLAADWNRYPPLRQVELQHKLAASLGVGPDMVLLGKGSNEILQTVLSATVQEGTGVIVTPPTFSLLPNMLQVFGARVLRVPLGKNFAFPVEEVIATCAREKASVIFLISPNNPTGTWISREDVVRVIEGCDALVVLDQAYIQYGPEGLLDLLERYQNVLYFRTFSKALQLAGARLGFCIARPEMITELNKVMLPFNFDHFSTIVTRVALEHPEPFERAVAFSIAERERLFQAMKAYPALEVFPSAANFLFFAAPREAGLFKAFLERGILIRPFGQLVDARDWLRVSVGRPEENDLFLAGLAELLG